VPVLKEFWHNFTFQTSTLEISETESLIFQIGNTEPLELDGYSFSINITEDGLCVCADSKNALLSGIMTLLDRIKSDPAKEETSAIIECAQIKDIPALKNRMVHYCIFPETELWELQRFIRFCGALKYTHVVLEFWGMLRYDCLKELSWSHAFTKDQIRPIIKEAHDLGLEIIPMFNHWGHATACRVMHGKHVVLDQNPKLQSFFSEDGWCWDISKKKVRELLRSIRHELCELCGDGDYFHIGCDEAYNFDFNGEGISSLCDFINETGKELNAAGRRAIMWGDMILYRHPHYNEKNRYTCNAPTPEIEKILLEKIDKSIVIADWQYHSPNYPIETASVFKNAGFDCLLCPWDEGEGQIKAVLDTAKTEKLFGFMHTTWHTLSKGTHYTLLAAVHGADENTNMIKNQSRTAAATLMRKVYPINGDYEKAGWGKFEIGCNW
jgi:hypothetical protein